MSCIYRRKPLMHVGKVLSAHRVDAFLNDKYKILCEKIEKDEARFVTYSKPAFIGMINTMFKEVTVDGLHIYLASYGEEGSDSVPENYGKLLTLIFAPTESKIDKGDYYTIFPRTNSFTKLTKELASAWVNNYQQYKLPWLNLTVPGPGPMGDDTKIIYFKRTSFKDLIDEMECQPATGIRGYFCTIEKDHEYEHRLMLDFILTTKVGDEVVEFNVEDRPDWNDRPEKLTDAELAQLSKDEKKDLDTGSPCPPNQCHSGLP